MNRFEQYTTGTPGEEQPPTPVNTLTTGNRFDQFTTGAPAAAAPAAAAPERSWLDTAKSAAQTADDAVRAAANAATFGMADRFAGYMSGTGTDTEVARSQAARERSPTASLGGDIAGSVALPGTISAKLATKLPATFAGRAAAYGLEGTAIGAAQGAGNTYTGNIGNYAENAAKGAVLGGVLGGVTGGVIGPRAPKSTAELPNKTEAKAFTDKAYQDLRANPTEYNTGALAGRATDLEKVLRADGYINAPGFSPGTFNALGTMQNIGSHTVTPADMDLIRQSLNKIPSGELHATDRSSARLVKDAIDDFIANPPQGALAAGAKQADAAEASRLARTAVDSRKAQGRIEMFENVMERSQQLANKPGATKSNVSQTQSHVTDYFLNPESKAAIYRMRAYNPAEREVLAAIPQTTRGERAGHAIGDFAVNLGGGNRLGTTALGLGVGGAYGYSQGDPLSGAAIALGSAGAGAGARSFANRIGQSRIDAAEALIKQRSPIYQERAAAAPMTSRNFPETASTIRNAIALELLKQQDQNRPKITVYARPEQAVR